MFRQRSSVMKMQIPRKRIYVKGEEANVIYEKYLDTSFEN